MDPINVRFAINDLVARFCQSFDDKELGRRCGTACATGCSRTILVPWRAAAHQRRPTNTSNSAGTRCGRRHAAQRPQPARQQ